MTILSPTLNTWYWQKKDSDRVISTNCYPMCSENWIEIDLSKFQELIILRKPIVPETKEEK